MKMEFVIMLSVYNYDLSFGPNCRLLYNRIWEALPTILILIAKWRSYFGKCLVPCTEYHYYKLLQILKPITREHFISDPKVSFLPTEENVVARRAYNYQIQGHWDFRDLHQPITFDITVNLEACPINIDLNSNWRMQHLLKIKLEVDYDPENRPSPVTSKHFPELTKFQEHPENAQNILEWWLAAPPSLFMLEEMRFTNMHAVVNRQCHEYSVQITPILKSRNKKGARKT